MSAALRPDGRWGGRLTSRPLPDDPAIDALPDVAREELAEHWLARAASERRVADAFAVVHRDLVEDGADPSLVALADRAVDDEMRHAELSRVVASRYAGRDLDAPPLLPLVVPAHPGASPRVVRALHVLGHCAINETLASAVLEAALAAAEGALAKAALRELLADEVDHARIGWAYLARLDAKERGALGPYVAGVVRANVRGWRITPRAYPGDPGLVAHGALSRALLESALRAGLADVILPGLAHVGLPVPPLEAVLGSVDATA